MFCQTLKFVLHSLFEERSKQLKNIFFGLELSLFDFKHIINVAV